MVLLMSVKALFKLLLVIVAIALTLLPRLPGGDDEAMVATTAWAVILLWSLVCIYVLTPLQSVLGWLRRVPWLFVLMWGMSPVVVLTVWVLTFQPAVAIPSSERGIYWLVIGMVWALTFWGAGMNAEARRALGVRARWGVGVALTVIALSGTLLGVELFLRYGMAMSDNFGFSKMHLNWARQHWQPVNELGYRDIEPAQNDPDLTHILIMGDSLVTGYGVDDINDTFPHQLGRALGDTYTVNIVARPGWGVSSAFWAMVEYPTSPDVLILSHYLNDIVEGDARVHYQATFPQIRFAPPPEWAWWVEATHLGNFYFYRLHHYFEHDSAGAYFDWTLNAYRDEAVWRAYEEELGRVVAYASSNNIPLYVIVWANLADVAGTAPYSAQVADYFAQQGVPVVDTGVLLIDEAPIDLVVNIFDSHPSIYAHQRASDALLSLMQVTSP